MQIDDNELLQLHAELCAMMGNPKRLAILEILQDAEKSVSEIAETLGVSISTVSQHLRLMKDRNVVSTRRDGQVVYYSLKHPELVHASHLIRKVLLDDLKQRGGIAREYDSETAGTVDPPAPSGGGPSIAPQNPQENAV